jgi:hypothetical protein
MPTQPTLSSASRPGPRLWRPRWWISQKPCTVSVEVLPRAEQYITWERATGEGPPRAHRPSSLSGAFVAAVESPPARQIRCWERRRRHIGTTTRRAGGWCEDRAILGSLAQPACRRAQPAGGHLIGWLRLRWNQWAESVQEKNELTCRALVFDLERSTSFPIRR